MFQYRQLIVIFLCIFSSFFASASKEVLVLFPIQVDEQDLRFESDFGTALQEGLQSRYQVYYGPGVEKELEREYQRVDCNAERCQQNVAIAFNGELIADASVKKFGTGYSIKFVVNNVMTGEIVESRTYPCRNCDVFTVIDTLKSIGRGEAPKPSSIQASSTPTTVANSASESTNAILIFDTEPSGANVYINGQAAGQTPYQGLQHKLGEVFSLRVEKDFFAPFEINVNIDKELMVFRQPFVLEPAQADILVSTQPFFPGARVKISGVDYGEIPQKLTVRAGEQTIDIEKDGKTLGSEKVTLASGSTTQHLVKVLSPNFNQEINPIVRIEPKYPVMAARDGLEGWVQLSFEINEVGGVENIQVINAEPQRIFDREAKRALNKWKYKPKVVNGVPQRQTGLTVQLDFKLGG